MRLGRLLVALAGLTPLLVAGTAHAAPTIEDYRDFRALSIDLKGRAPTRDEIAAFEAPGFDRTAWIDAHLDKPEYAERVTRIYLDALRLELPPVVQFQRPNVNLQRIDLLIEGGKRVPVYYRFGQRRTTQTIERRFCLTDAETGLKIGRNTLDATTEIQVPLALLSSRAKKVKPWWLYRDYAKGAAATDRYDVAKWNQPGVAAFRILPGLDKEPDGTATQDVWVCNEEANESPTGHILGTPDEYSKAHKNEVIACTGANSFTRAADCGCGPGLERCLPASRNNPESAVFEYPVDVALGVDMPLAVRGTSQGGAARLWWAEEARHFMQLLFSQDRDVRDLLTAKYSTVNGPLAQFYRWQADATCCGDGIYFGQKESEALFDPKKVPALAPHEVSSWKEVTDRGPLASGIMTMPVFLTKYGTRRARAHALYQGFLCKEFVAPPGLALPPSNEQNLMKRAGCAACHATLEPMSAYFSRIRESDWTFLSPATFPTTNTACSMKDGVLGTPGNSGLTPARCNQYYDPAFSTASGGVLRGAQPDILAPNGTSRADLGPRGLADQIINDGEFASCVAKNVAGSFLGRPLDADDEALKKLLVDALVQSGFHMRPVVRALLVSETYKKANNLTSAAWRKEVSK